MINTCLDSHLYPKCKGCPHNRPDPDSYDGRACFLDEDLVGEERRKYLYRLFKTLSPEEQAEILSK